MNPTDRPAASPKGRDAAAGRRPADATGCIGKSAPVGDREADDPGLRNRVKAHAEPHPACSEIAATAALSLARERFAESGRADLGRAE